MSTFVKPEITLVLATSVDGRLTGSDSHDLDRDKQWKHKEGVRGYLQQAFELSSEQGVYNLVAGRSIAQTGINYRTNKPVRENIRLVVLDHHRDLSPQGINYLASCVKSLIVICGVAHPITKITRKPKNLSLIVQPRFNRQDTVRALAKHKVKKITIQSAGKLNAGWINDGMVDQITVILYPLLIGTSGTPSLESEELSIVKPLRLIETKTFNFNYIALTYQVINS